MSSFTKVELPLDVIFNVNMNELYLAKWRENEPLTKKILDGTVDTLI